MHKHKKVKTHREELGPSATLIQMILARKDTNDFTRNFKSFIKRQDQRVANHTDEYGRTALILLVKFNRLCAATELLNRFPNIDLTQTDPENGYTVWDYLDAQLSNGKSHKQEFLAKLSGYMKAVAPPAVSPQDKTIEHDEDEDEDEDEDGDLEAEKKVFIPQIISALPRPPEPVELPALFPEIDGISASFPQCIPIAMPMPFNPPSPSKVALPSAAFQEIFPLILMSTDSDEDVAVLSRYVTLNRGCLNAVGRDNMSILYFALANKKHQSAICLVEEGVSPNQAPPSNDEYFSKYKLTPLMMAVLASHQDLVKVLLRKQADVNAVNAINATALHIAAVHGYWGIARLLLDNKIDHALKNKNGHTALDLAIRERDTCTSKGESLKAAEYEKIIAEISRCQIGGATNTVWRPSAHPPSTQQTGLFKHVGSFFSHSS